jgi:hypothetical protein
MASGLIGIGGSSLPTLSPSGASLGRYISAADRFRQKSSAHRPTPFCFNSGKKVKSARASGVKEPGSGRRRRAVIGSEHPSNKKIST